MSSRDVAADYKLLATINPILDPRTRTSPDLVDAVLSLSDYAFEPLLVNRVQHIRCGCFEVIRYANSACTEFEGRTHDLPALDQWQPSEITALVDEQIKDEEMNA